MAKSAEHSRKEIEATVKEDTGKGVNKPVPSLPLPPAGLKALIDVLHGIYPDQPNPLQVTTLLKYWLGGQDPLDYISMYSNHGDEEKNIPPHWHYVSFGLSDLHGDGRVHSINDNNNKMNNDRSGMGFELTFRLQKTPEELREEQNNPDKTKRPPTWPANLLQSIARYCFQSGNVLCFGDNIPMRASLDGSGKSHLQNILIAQDAQLGTLDGPFGMVDFCQIVGVTNEELEQASRWNGRGVLNYLKQDVKTGGEWLITNMDRSLSVFELFPERLISLQDDLEKQGSDLAGVNVEFVFREIIQPQVASNETETEATINEINSNSLNVQCKVDENNQSMDKLSLTATITPTTKAPKDGLTTFPKSMSLNNNSLKKSCPLNYQPQAPQCVFFDGIEITLAPASAKYLMLAVKDRIRHGRHFTFKAQHLALTFVAESVTGAVVTKVKPYGIVGYWLHVLISDELIPRMIVDFQKANLEKRTEFDQCLVFNWPDKNLKLIIDRSDFSIIPQPISIFALH